MDERRQGVKPTGLPRPSRLPVGTSNTSSATTSHSTPSLLPSSTNNRPQGLRPVRSRPSLSGDALGGEICNPKLRSVASRSRLSLPVSGPPAASSSSGVRHPPPRTRAVSGQYVQATKPPSGIARPPGIAHPSRPAADSTGHLKKPAPRTLGRRTSTQHLTHPTSPSPPHSISPVDDDVAIGTLDAADTLQPRNMRSRQSLAERTIETLSQLPNSPGSKGRRSSFFDGEGGHLAQSRRGSSSGSTSRPGSSYQSEGSFSRPQSRPDSSSRQDETAPNFRASMNQLRGVTQSSILPIDEVPGNHRPVSSTRSLQKMPSRTSLNSTMRGPSTQTKPGGMRIASPSKLSMPGTTTASSSGHTVPGRLGSKPASSRTLQTRPSMNRLLKKPSMSSLDSSVPSSAATRKDSLVSRGSSTSYEEAQPSGASTTSTAQSTDSTESAAIANSRKSSNALREQIAKAKAARRAAAQHVAKLEKEGSVHGSAAAPESENEFGQSDETTVVPTDRTFDFGLNADPFGQNRNEQASAKVIRTRIEGARASGRLNIAAMGLREIPKDVMDMYKTQSTSVSWAESVDLTRFVAADNEIEMIEDSVFPDVDVEEMADNDEGNFNIFGGLETLDLHGNMLICLPLGLRRLQMLTSLNLSQNRITNNALEVISQIPSLHDLKLGGNLFYGPLDPCFAKLEHLEIADLHGNNISMLPLTIGNMSKLRILNISENAFESLVFEPLSKLPLTELIVRKNKLSGVLIEDTVPSLPNLQVLDVSANQITHLVSPSRTDNLELPKLHNLCISMNRLQELPEVGKWSNLVTLAAEENNISNVPVGFSTLSSLRHADFSSNDIRVIPSEIGRMENLAMLRLGSNPLRDKRFCTATTDDIKTVLAGRLAPEPEPEPEQEPEPEPKQKQKPWAGLGVSADEMQDELRDAVTELTNKTGTHGRQRSSNVGLTGDDNASDERSEEDFTTPPTSTPHTPARSRSHTLSNQLWPVKAGGLLDRSETGSAALNPVMASRVAREHVVRDILLHRNMFTTLPDALSFFAETLSVLSLSHNELSGESYLGDSAVSEGLDLPALRELNLSSNHITGLGPLVRHLRAPALQKLDVGVNRVATLPAGGQLRAAFPVLTVLLANDNRLSDLDPESIAGLRIVDVTNNDIEHLNPRIGLLGGAGGLERLNVLGNRFRVPRFNVLERGTEATLRWLRGRVPVAEMGVWREANKSSPEVDEEVD